MPIQFISGDLFANRFQAQALAHGCNCQGSMGAGIATGLRHAMHITTSVFINDEQGLHQDFRKWLEDRQESHGRDTSTTRGR